MEYLITGILALLILIYYKLDFIFDKSKNISRALNNIENSLAEPPQKNG